MLKGGRKMNRNMFLTLILLVLLVVAAAQAVQLTSLKAKLLSGLSVDSKATSPAASASQISTPKSLENLPKMVGGC